MNLLILIHSLSSGGAERVVTNLANYWAEKGWNITIVTMAGRELDFYDLHSSIHRIALYLDAGSTNLLAAISHNYRRVRALRAVLKQHRPDVTLGIMTTANILLGLAAMGLNIPVIGSERIHPPMFLLGRVWEWLRRRSYPHLVAVTALTEKNAEWLRGHTAARYVPVIPNPIPYPIESHAPYVSPRLSTCGVQGRFTMLAVGRLAPQKGFDRLLLAFGALALRFPDWNLTILGEGECRHQLENRVAELGLESRVSLPGVAGNVGEWYQTADLYVLTSLFEGFPNTLVEALAYGLPAVSVDCETGPADILRHDVAGLLVPQDDLAELVEALAKLMSDKSLRYQYSARAVEIRQRLSIEKIAGMWERLFEEVSK